MYHTMYIIRIPYTASTTQTPYLYHILRLQPKHHTYTIYYDYNPTQQRKMRTIAGRPVLQLAPRPVRAPLPDSERVPNHTEEEDEEEETSEMEVEDEDKEEDEMEVEEEVEDEESLVKQLSERRAAYRIRTVYQNDSFKISKINRLTTWFVILPTVYIYVIYIYIYVYYL